MEVEWGLKRAPHHVQHAPRLQLRVPGLARHLLHLGDDGSRGLACVRVLQWAEADLRWEPWLCSRGGDLWLEPGSLCTVICALNQVMLAASYWSLLAPAVEMATSSGGFGAFAFFPVAVGFTFGAAFVYLADLLMPHLGAAEDPQTALALNFDPVLTKKSDAEHPGLLFPESELSIRIDKSENGEAYQRKKMMVLPEGPAAPVPFREAPALPGGHSSWRRIALLILAITIHNIPEGLAVGVGFGAVEKTASATFESARNLAIGIGIQNFPEGLAVSLPLRGAGFSTWRAFWYGQLSGMVEPLAGVFGAFAVVLAEPLLPYALAFAAGAMVYVVMDDIIPEAQISGNGKLASWASILGFVVMMSLDVGLG